MMGRLFCFGLGYSALVLARRLKARGWSVAGTCRTADKAAALAAEQIAAHLFDRGHPLDPAALAGATHLLLSIPPDADADPVLAHLPDTPGLVWAGYLSTTGVYGDRGGAWVDEASELRPSGERGRRRVAAEAGWLRLWREQGLPVHIFRLAAIYGPGRSPFEALRQGTARRIDKPGQVFSRIHVEDLASVLEASMARPRPGAVYNVCDDLPTPPQEVVACAARLLGVPVPPLVPIADAGLSPMARSFYDDSKRVSNTLIKDELGVRLSYPDYRAGLAAILEAETHGAFPPPFPPPQAGQG